MPAPNPRYCPRCGDPLPGCSCPPPSDPPKPVPPAEPYDPKKK